MLAGFFLADGEVFHQPGPDALVVDAFAEPFERLLRDGAADGSLRDLPPTLTATVLFNLVGWGYIHLRAAHHWDAAATADAIIDLLLQGTLDREEPAREQPIGMDVRDDRSGRVHRAHRGPRRRARRQPRSRLRRDRPVSPGPGRPVHQSDRRCGAPGQPDPPAGLDLAQRIIAACTAKDQYLQTRTALHHGPATQRGDDFFGATVNLTARLCAHAAAGQTLVTGPVADAARTLALTITDLGEATFKNITEPTPIYALDLGASTSMQSMDPICRMRIEHDRAAGYLPPQRAPILVLLSGLRHTVPAPS